MLIRKQFQFNNMHIVRNCSSERCKRSIHSHTYSVEVVVQGGKLDNGQMVMDFGLFKPTIGEFVKSFDNAYTIWDAEPESFKNMIANHCPRVIITPTSPSAEAISLMMYHAIDAIIKNTQFNNGENANSMSLHSVRVHETTSGWAEATNKTWGNWNGWWNFGIQDIKFSDAIVKSWKDPEFWNKLVNSEPYVNPVVEQQIVLESTKQVQIELV